MQLRERWKSGQWSGTALCVVLFLVCLRIAHPVLEAGFGDDFSYIFTAKRAAETGRLIYNGWACPMLGVQVYLAALLIRIFGFSFTVARAAVWIIATVNIAVLHRLFLRLTTRNRNAVVAALCVALGPVTFTHSVVFFTDLPGQFAFVVAMLCCVRAMQATTDAETRRWLVWCVVLNLFLGTVRQTAWLGSLLLLPAAGWRLRHRVGVLRLTVTLWLVSVAIVGAGVWWLSHAPYAPQESLFTHLSKGWLVFLPTLPVMTLLEVLPLLFAIPAIREVRRNKRLVALSLAAAMLAATFCWANGTVYSQSFTLSLLHGEMPHAVLIGGVLTTVAVLLFAMAVQESVVAFAASPKCESDLVSFRDLLAVTWPYLLVVSALVMTREGVWARYILTLTPVCAALLLRLHAERTNCARFSLTPVVMTAAWVALGTVIAHDDMLVQLPFLRLERQYLALGLPRQQLEAGMVEDGWYELSTGDHINEPRIHVPQDAYVPRTLTPEQRRCHMYFLPYSPDIHPVYVISWFLTSPCYQQPPLATDSQTFWMRPHSNFGLFRYIPSQQMP